MIKIFLTVFLTSIIGRISTTFPFDLSKISENDVNFPDIIKMSIDDSSNRPIGAYPVNHESIILGTSTDTTTSLKTPAPAPLIDLDMPSYSSGITQNKRKRTAQVKAITANMTIEEIIEIEIKECGFHKEEKRVQFRKTLQLIAKNDREAFYADERNFKAVFGKVYVSFKKDESDFYLIRFFIMFGADQIFRRNFKKTVIATEKSHRLAEAFNYLIKTKPFSILIDLLGLGQTFSFKFGNDTYKNIADSIKVHYPNLPFFKNLFVESLSARSLALYINVFKEEDERIAFNLIPNLCKIDTWGIKKEFNNIKFHTAVLRYPEYYLAMDDASKFVFISICLVYDDVENFEKIVDLYPEIVSYVKLAEKDFDYDENIFHKAISNYAVDCIRFLCEIAPELITFSTPKMRSALKLAFVLGDSSLFDVFYNFGYNESYILRTDDDKMELNLIQYAFYYNLYELLVYFINKVGLVFVREEIKNVWKTVEQVLILSLNQKSFRYKCSCIPLIIKLFDIDVNATYRYDNLEGNAMIFLEQQYRQVYHQIPDLNHDAPVYSVDPLTGTRSILFDWLNKIRFE